MNSYEYLKSLCEKGLNKRLNNNVSSEYKDRLEYELSVINKMGFCDYFLIVWDYVKYAKFNNILVGPGRGSAAGSLVSYTLGITGIDPIKYNLLLIILNSIVLGDTSPITILVPFDIVLQLPLS